jgi:hypothetical protein
MDRQRRYIVINKSFIVTPSPLAINEGIVMTKSAIDSDEAWKTIAKERFGVDVLSDPQYSNLAFYTS